MTHIMKHRFLIGTMGFYFGWLLSFPLYGPVAFKMEEVATNQPFSLMTVFALFHGLAYLAGAFAFRSQHRALGFMQGGIAMAISVNLLMLFAPNQVLWMPSMALLGIASSLFTLGWAKHYARFSDLIHKQKTIAWIIILANLIFVGINRLSAVLVFRELLVVGLVPLFVALVFALLPESVAEHKDRSVPVTQPVPKGLLVVFVAFIFALNLNGGLLYGNMMPMLTLKMPELAQYRFVPYIIAMAFLLYLTGRYKLELLIYIGVSLLGISFVSYALLYDLPFGVVITSIMVESAFAMLDLFLWSVLGLLSYLYGAPHLFFGTVLWANVTSVLVGNGIGQYLAQTIYPKKYTALLAGGIIFVTFAIMPWIQEKIRSSQAALEASNAPPVEEPAEKSFAEKLAEFVLPGMSLTPKEQEILELIVSGRTNQEMADLLFISINTLKTHLRHIYGKFGINQKRQLMELARNVEKSPR